MAFATIPRAPIGAVLAATFFASVSSGAFWAAIFFVTARWYGFSPTHNLILGAAIGCVYALAAWRAGALLRAVAVRLSPRTVLLVILNLWGAASLLPLLVPERATVLWLIALAGSAASATAFPIIESYLTAGRRGADLRRAIGWFNVTWTTATALPLLIMPLLPASAALWTLALTAIANAVATLVLLRVPRAPGAVKHVDDDASPVRETREHEYPDLQRTSGALLPLSYLLCAAMVPVLPHRLLALGVPDVASAVGATWMLARFLALLLMWQSGFWHGRWETLLAAGIALLGGVTMVLLGQTLATVVCGLLVFGAGMGLTYYAALYYTLAVGHGAVDAGGAFEALVGLGYGVGPLVGLAAHARLVPFHPDGVTAAIIWGVVAVAMLPIVRPYRRARAARTESLPAMRPGPPRWRS